MTLVAPMPQSRTFIALLTKALSPPSAGFAAGTLGFSEQSWLHAARAGS
jgi:hypothetical protein